LFLDTMMDAYAQGFTTGFRKAIPTNLVWRVPRSFTTTPSRSCSAAARQGTGFGPRQGAGKRLAVRPANGSRADGRVRQAYFVDHADAQGVFIIPSGFPFFFLGSATGDMAWTGMALAQLAHRTGISAYLDGAVRLGN